MGLPIYRTPHRGVSNVLRTTIPNPTAEDYAMSPIVRDSFGQSKAEARKAQA